MDYTTRYKNLNDVQKKAVDTIDGPVMVIAGPGTGKTELLSMRTANILRQTDTLASSILCLTFTESGAKAMRERLIQIIGREAYHVAINTFHGFGSEIIANNREYFYRGAEFRPADDLAQLEILTSIFENLDHTNILVSRMNGEYTYLREALRTISELKRSGLTSDELLKILDASDAVLDYIEPSIREIFSERVSPKMTEKLPAIIQKLADFTPDTLPPGLSPLSDVLMHSLMRVYAEASETDSTKPLTTWKKQWTEPNSRKELVLKDRKRHEKLRAISYIYYQYLVKMQEAALYDYDDMILEVIHAMETQSDLKANLQETYQYIMVDEFQDTNLAQLRLLLNLVDNPVSEGTPNLLVVGDDDQAIYSFQGADVGNILQLRKTYPAFQTIVLTDNYRSAPAILGTARSVIIQGTERLEATDSSLDKTLIPHVTPAKSTVKLCEYPTSYNEREAIADSIAARIKAGQSASSIAILAKRHAELEALVPYLVDRKIPVSYEHSDNVLDLDFIKQLEMITRVILAMYHKRLQTAEALLPELLSHPAWNIAPDILWKLSLTSYNEHRLWLDYMSVTPELSDLHAWLIESVMLVPHEPLERMIDRLVGLPDDQEVPFRSPLFDYFFSETERNVHPEAYLLFLNALQKLRSGLREYVQGNEQAIIEDFLEYIDLHRIYKQAITLTTKNDAANSDAVQILSVHKSKGLEFESVYITGLSDDKWGSRSRSRSSIISYPANLPFRPNTGSLDEQIRLLFVGMTRAKRTLDLSYSTVGETGREHLMSDLLISDALIADVIPPNDSVETLTAQAEFDWHAHAVALPQSTMKDLLSPLLSKYKLSATHINNFIDVTRGGPEYFLTQNLLHFPSAPSPAAAYGTAIHAALQTAQNHLLATGETRPLEDSLHDFEAMLTPGTLDEKDTTFYTKKGYDTLQAFLNSPYTGFSKNAKSELNFGQESVHVGEATLTGKLDLVTIDKSAKTLSVIDYKTGKPAIKWTGGADYEKVKLHKYKQQLMFYKMLTENSRSYRAHSYDGGALQFVEPDKSGEILPPLEAVFDDEEYETFQKLVAAVWHCIITLDLPDISEYEATYKGLQAFEQALIDKYV